jgi:hypothetical protein
MFCLFREKFTHRHVQASFSRLFRVPNLKTKKKLSSYLYNILAFHFIGIENGLNFKTCGGILIEKCALSSWIIVSSLSKHLVEGAKDKSQI